MVAVFTGSASADEYDYEALAWKCGLEPGPWDFDRPENLILRPDRFDGGNPRQAVLQKIIGGFRRSIFKHSIEESFRQVIHHEALRRAGLPWPPPYDDRWWSSDKKQQARNRGRYHGLRLLSLTVINDLIGQVIEKAADADAIKAARRFPFRDRLQMYRAAARSRRALQLMDTFPLLATIIFNTYQPASLHRAYRHEWSAARKTAAAELVERGARLRDVAEAMGIPMALRRLKPGVAHLACKVLFDRPELLDLMPDRLPNMRIWLGAVRFADARAGSGFAEWAAQHVPHIPGRFEQVASIVSDLADWVIAGQPLKPSEALESMSDDPQVRAGAQFVVRPFAPGMSLRTVTKLSADWHEAVAANMDGPDFAFPAPWFPAAKLGDYELMPIESSAELYREGSAMHHCVGTFASEVRCGHFCIFSIRLDGERVATLSLFRSNNRAELAELRGPCNAPEPKEITGAVRHWLRTQGPLPPLVFDHPMTGVAHVF
jgi:hypothetical protein